MAEYCDALARINRILIDLSRDAWTYISMGYFRQKAVRSETGSSTMPHKVNPINLENAEGNLGLSNALLGHFSEKLPVSRLQRDLSDSTVLRNLGIALGHALVAWTEVRKGLEKLSPDGRRMAQDLDSAWETLTEAVQTVMRAHGCEDAYDRLKIFSRNQDITRDSLHAFLRQEALPETAREAAARPHSRDVHGHRGEAGGVRFSRVRHGNGGAVRRSRFRSGCPAPSRRGPRGRSAAHDQLGGTGRRLPRRR